MIRRVFYGGGPGWAGSLGLLVLRLVMGAAFVLHGWPKIQNPFGWMPTPQSTAATKSAPDQKASAPEAAAKSDSQPSPRPRPGPFPAPLQALAALSEFGGGIALLAGALTRLAALGIGATMFVATFLVHVAAGHPFVGKEGTYELPAVYLACAVLFLLMGPGRFSVDAVLFAKKVD